MFPQTRQALRADVGTVSLALIVCTALTQVTATLLTLPYYLGDLELYFSDWYYYLMDPLVFYPTSMLTFWLMLRHLPQPDLVPGPTPRLGEILSCAVTAVGLLYAASWVTEALLAGTSTVDYANNAIRQEPLFFSILCTVIIAPACEEFIFRYLLLDRLLYMGDWAAVLVSSLFFGLFHTNLYQFLYAFAVGLVLGYVRIMTGRVGWSILLHMFINLFCGVLVGYLPNEDWVNLALMGTILACVCYAFATILSKQPWLDFYPGPTRLSARDKAWAFFTSPAFWICVAVHLGLSVYYISY